MANYLFIYHGGGGMPESKEDGEKMMAHWMSWFGEMGDAVVDGGNPVGMSKTVSAKETVDNGGANPTTGYTVVKAASIEAACKLAKGCPMVVNGTGSVEVAPIVEM